MKECKKFELALYCFSEPDTWVFRTKREMEEKRASIYGCSIYQQARESNSEAAPEASQVSDLRR